jgi:hypothetical protein
MSSTYERNGIRAGERVVIAGFSVLGTVTRCAPDGVDVRWDDGRLGELAWRHDVAHNAFRLEPVRPAGPLSGMRIRLDDRMPRNRIGLEGPRGCAFMDVEP